MRRKKVQVQTGPFYEKKKDDRRAPVHITIGGFQPGYRFRDTTPRGVMKAIRRTLISFAAAVILYLIIVHLK